jgi:hypothetical protein
MNQRDSEALRKVLNSHGAGFQYSTLKRCIEVDAIVPWHFVVSEHPVTLRGKVVHIDFVLACQTHLMVAECKRVSRFRWGFARSFSGVIGRVRADCLQYEPTNRIVRKASFIENARPYDVMVELKTHDQKSTDDDSSSSKSFDFAVEQVLRGRSGLMDELAAETNLRYGGGAFIPVIFTTAPLVVTDTEMTKANPLDGNLPPLDAVEVPWLWFDASLSSSLRPELPLSQPNRGAPTKTQSVQITHGREIRRSIAIVNSQGIDKFLTSLACTLMSPPELI